ncbi:MAG: hypothetical protein ACJAW3_000050 [Lentimonas sp.]|jgi:hypothetical protein
MQSSKQSPAKLTDSQNDYVSSREEGENVEYSFEELQEVSLKLKNAAVESLKSLDDEIKDLESGEVSQSNGSKRTPKEKKRITFSEEGYEALNEEFDNAASALLEFVSRVISGNADNFLLECVILFFDKIKEEDSIKGAIEKFEAEDTITGGLVAVSEYLRGAVKAFNLLKDLSFVAEGNPEVIKTEVLNCCSILITTTLSFLEVDLVISYLDEKLGLIEALKKDKYTRAQESEDKASKAEKELIEEEERGGNKSVGGKTSKKKPSVKSSSNKKKAPADSVIKKVKQPDLLKQTSVLIEKRALDDDSKGLVVTGGKKSDAKSHLPSTEDLSVILRKFVSWQESDDSKEDKKSGDVKRNLRLEGSEEKAIFVQFLHVNAEIKDDAVLTELTKNYGEEGESIYAQIISLRKQLISEEPLKESSDLPAENTESSPQEVLIKFALDKNNQKLIKKCSQMLGLEVGVGELKILVEDSKKNNSKEIEILLQGVRNLVGAAAQFVKDGKADFVDRNRLTDMRGEDKLEILLDKVCEDNLPYLREVMVAVSSKLEPGRPRSSSEPKSFIPLNTGVVLGAVHL